MVALPPSPAPPHGQDGVSVHSGSRERERRCGDSGGGRRHLGRGRQPPLVLKPETTRSGLIYRERRGGKEGGGTGHREYRGGRGGETGLGLQGLHKIKTLMPFKRMKVALAMPQLEVAEMDEQLRGGSTSNTPHKKNEREKEKKKLCMYNSTEH